MCLLFETIKIVDGKPVNLLNHEERMKRSVREVFGLEHEYRLIKEIDVPGIYQQGVVKCRIVYKEKILQIEFEPYRARKVNSLRLVDSSIAYPLKFQDRKVLQELVKLKGNCDDILIVKNGLVTDTSFSNICFYQKESKKWLTPKTPLLAGTKRQYYLDRKQIFESDIKVSDLELFSSVGLINAMLDLRHEQISIIH